MATRSGGNRVLTAMVLATVLMALTTASTEEPEKQSYSGGYRGPDRTGIYPADGLLEKWPDRDRSCCGPGTG